MTTLHPIAPRIGIMAAMPQELQAVLALMPDEHRETVAGRSFWPGHLAGHDVVAVVSGIGKVAAATTATLLIERFGASCVLFTGVAGGVGEGVAVGDVVVATQLMQHDLDVSPLFPRHEVPGYGLTRFNADAHWQCRLADAARATLADRTVHLGAQAVADFGLSAARVHNGLVISGDRFVATSAESHALRQELPDALAVEMEGAAVAQVCHDFGVPFAAVRTSSDRADDSAHVDFNRFVSDVASCYSAAMLLACLQAQTQANAEAAAKAKT